MAQVIWTPQSERDLTEIFEYIRQDSERYAWIQVEKIVEHVFLMSKSPLSGRIVSELDNEKVRQWVVGNYRVIYRVISDSQIDILTVHHGARLLKEEMFEDE